VLRKIYDPVRTMTRMNPSAIALVVYWIVMFTGTHYPRPPHFLLPLQHSDKVLHFVGFAGLAFLFAVVLRHRWSWAMGFWIAGLVSVYGALDELTQPWVGRDCELLDWVADVLGTIGGLAAFLVAAMVMRHKNRARISDDQ